VGSLKIWVAFEDDHLFYRILLPKRDLYCSSLLQKIAVLFCTKLQFSFAEYRLFYRAVLLKRDLYKCRPIFGGSLLIVAISYAKTSMLRQNCAA